MPIKSNNLERISNGAGTILKNIFITILINIASIQSKSLYIRLLFWLVTVVLSILPFLFVETKVFSDLNINVNHFYKTHYEGILSVFVVTIAVAMFDVMAATLLLASYNSIISVCTAVILGGLMIFFAIVCFTLGFAIMSPPPEPMPGAFLSISALWCWISTGFVAVLSNEYQPKKVSSPRNINSKKARG